WALATEGRSTAGFVSAINKIKCTVLGGITLIPNRGNTSPSVGTLQRILCRSRCINLSPYLPPLFQIQSSAAPFHGRGRRLSAIDTEANSAPCHVIRIPQQKEGSSACVVSKRALFSVLK